MENKATVSETLRRILLLNNSLQDLIQFKNEAFTVFDQFLPLDKMNEIFESSWTELINWDRTHEEAPNLYMQDYNEIRGIFCSVTLAHINRDEFEKALAKSCEAIEKCTQKIQAELSAEEKKLDELYTKFTQNAGDLKFIFENESVKNLIIDKLLKS